MLGAISRAAGEASAMAAAVKQPEPDLGPPARDFLVIAEQDGDHITGIECSLDRALGVARVLAMTGHTVTIQAVDPFVDDDVEYVVRRRT
jgi:hypothetical protein